MVDGDALNSASTSNRSLSMHSRQCYMYDCTFEGHYGGVGEGVRPIRTRRTDPVHEEFCSKSHIQNTHDE